MAFGADQQKRAVDSGVWPLYRFDPRRVPEGKPPLQLDSGNARISPQEYMKHEARFRMVERVDPERYRRLLQEAERSAARRLSIYQQLAGMTIPPDETESV
jgi:pyruvate-ferredoxin/flavodoxin oxidoreductase